MISTPFRSAHCACEYKEMPCSTSRLLPWAHLNGLFALCRNGSAVCFSQPAFDRVGPFSSIAVGSAVMCGIRAR